MSMPKGGEKKAAQVQSLMTKEEMIKWFLDNLKPPYYEKMISVPVPHFANLIPIREHVDEGIISKKIIDPTTLYSLMEQQLRENDAKVKERDIHMVARNREVQIAKSIPIRKAKGNFC